MNEYDEIAPYYDSMYADRTEDVDFYLNWARDHGGPVLECGCGTGRILVPIANAGIEIWGLDASQEMLRLARKKVEKLARNVREKIQLFAQDIRNFDIGRTFQLCFVPFGAFLHLLTIDDQDRTLQRLRQHLRTDGRLVIDLFAPSYELLAQKECTLDIEEKVNLETGCRFTITDYTRYEHAAQLIHVERVYEEIDDEGGLTRKVLPFKLRYVFRYEMQALLEKNGFRVSEVFGTFDKRPYDYYSGEMIFVAKKVVGGE